MSQALVNFVQNVFGYTFCLLCSYKSHAFLWKYTFLGASVCNVQVCVCQCVSVSLPLPSAYRWHLTHAFKLFCHRFHLNSFYPQRVFFDVSKIYIDNFLQLSSKCNGQGYYWTTSNGYQQLQEKTLINIYLFIYSI